MLISSRTPLRVSFFGGGTDFPEYFAGRRGAVVGMAINKYIYISVVHLTSFLEYKYRISYSKLEFADRPEDIQHPVIREALRHFGVEKALDINVMSDLPANTGLGSSSVFTVGFVNLIAALQSRNFTKLDLARQAIFIEREVLEEHVGFQDQLHAAFGGLNRFDFEDNRIRISPLKMSGDCLEHLLNSLVLLYTGIKRRASDVLEEQIQSTVEKKLDRDLAELLVLTDQVVSVLEGKDPETVVGDFAVMLHEGWQIKRRLAKSITNQTIDEIYGAALKHGAMGGKLCGAGGGGFLLMVVPPRLQEDLTNSIAPVRLVKIGLDTQGSTIIRS